MGVGTREVIDRLKADGFDCNESYLTFLVRQGHVAAPEKVCHALVWADADVHRVKAALWRRGRGPQASRAGGRP